MESRCFFLNRGLSGLCRKYCPVKFSWQRTYGAAHPQAFVSCLKARLSEENIFCIDCFELRIEMMRSSSVTFFHPKLYHILPVVHIVILNISALYNFICIIAKYIQPPNRDWMENVCFSGMSFSFLIAFCFWGNKRQIWTIDDRKLWMGATLLKSSSLCLSEWIGGRPRKDLNKSQFSHFNENPSFNLYFVFECTNTIVQEMWNCEENLAADLERNTLWTLFHIRAFQWNFSSHAFWQSRKFTEAKVLHHEFFIRGLLKIFFLSF